MEFINKIFHGQAKECLRSLPDSIVDTCVTSPPYWGLRDYGVDGQLGQEPTPELYVNNLVSVFQDVRRILKDDGTLWLNLGDSYGGSGKGSATHPESNWKYKQGTNKGAHNKGINNYSSDKIKPKDLVGIPWMVAFALRADGWYLRQDIIWNKPNPMPESVKDRCTKSHEYIFLLSKSKKYYYDYEAIKQPLKDASIARLIQDIENQEGSSRVQGKTNGKMKAVRPSTKRKGDQTDNDVSMGLNGSSFKNHNNYLKEDGSLLHGTKANKKSVWTQVTKPFKEAHFATFPQELIVDCIKAGCPEGGIVLDPFMGAGTTAIVSQKLNRNYLGVELNGKYISIADNRLNKELGMFKDTVFAPLATR